MSGNYAKYLKTDGKSGRSHPAFEKTCKVLSGTFKALEASFFKVILGNNNRGGEQG